MGRKDKDHREGSGGSLGDLLRAKGVEGDPARAPDPEPPPDAAPDEPDLSGKVVVRRTRKGRGGKTVTLVQGAGGDLSDLATRLKKGLGTGAKVEGDEIAVQGDQVDRVVELLGRLGAGRIVVG